MNRCTVMSSPPCDPSGLVRDTLMGVTQDHARRQIPVQIRLDVPGIGEIRCSRVLRAIPHRRVVCVGELNHARVIVKLYFDRKRAYANWRRSNRGCRAFVERGIPAPGILFSGYIPACGLYAIVHEYVEGGVRADVSLSGASDTEKRLEMLGRLSRILACHHEAGILQQDLHLGNFLVQEDRIYSLDGDRVEIFKRPVGMRRSLENIALLLSNVPSLCEEDAKACLDAYSVQRGVGISARQRRLVEKRAKAFRKRALASYMKKTLRPKDPFRVDIREGLFAVTDTRHTDVDFSLLTEKEDRCGRAGLLGDTGLDLMDVGGRIYVHHSSLAFGPLAGKRMFPGVRLWRRSLLVRRIGIPSLEPLALVLRRSAPLVWRCSVWFRHREGIPLDAFLGLDGVSPQEKKKLAIQLARALEIAEEFGLVVAGLKPGDVVVSSSGPVFINPRAFRKGVMGKGGSPGVERLRELFGPFLSGQGA